MQKVLSDCNCAMQNKMEMKMNTQDLKKIRQELMNKIKKEKINIENINQLNLQKVVDEDEIFWRVELHETSGNWNNATTWASDKKAKEILLALYNDEKWAEITKFWDWEEEWTTFLIYQNGKWLETNSVNIIQKNEEEENFVSENLSDFQKDNLEI